MPPHQCPSCGSSVRRDVVGHVPEEPVPCPGCGRPFDASTSGSDGSKRSGAAAASVRPPDLPPETVRDGGRDVLAGWDTGVTSTQPGRGRLDRAPFPTDTVVVMGVGMAGGVLGALLTRRSGRGAGLGTLGGLVVAGGARRIWRLEP